MSNLPDLPKTDDKYWEGAEKSAHPPIKIGICEMHTREHWAEGWSYVDNADGTINCTLCSWGTILPVGYRIKNGKVIDLWESTRR